MSEPKIVKHRREVRVKDLYIYFALPLFMLVIILSLYITNIFTHFIPLKLIYITLIAFAIMYPFMRMLAMGCILMYKAFAPLDVRKKCRFTPTCSTYALMAIQKYGIIIGVTMGVKRVRRCKPPNGGIDYPQLFKKRKGENENE